MLLLNIVSNEYKHTITFFNLQAFFEIFSTLKKSTLNAKKIYKFALLAFCTIYIAVLLLILHK